MSKTILNLKISNKPLELSKVVISKVFGISRSAVSQSCSHRTIEEDITQRVFKYIMGRLPDHNTRIHKAQEVSIDILRILRVETAIREKVRTFAGRPLKKVNFRAFKSLIRAVVAQLTAEKALISAIDKFDTTTWQPFGPSISRRTVPTMPDIDDDSLFELPKGARRLRPIPNF